MDQYRNTVPKELRDKMLRFVFEHYNTATRGMARISGTGYCWWKETFLYNFNASYLRITEADIQEHGVWLIDTLRDCIEEVELHWAKEEEKRKKEEEAREIAAAKQRAKEAFEKLFDQIANCEICGHYAPLHVYSQSDVPIKLCKDCLADVALPSKPLKPIKPIKPPKWWRVWGNWNNP